MSATVQQAVPKLCASEVWALYGGELEYCLGGDERGEQEAEDFDHHSECSDGQASADEPSCPSAPEYELIRQDTQDQPSFSTQDYYSQLEALKRMHLQDIADLEVMCMSNLSANREMVSQGTQVNNKEEPDSAQEDSEDLPGRGETSAMFLQELKPQQKSVSKSDTPERWGMEAENKRREEEEREEEEKEEKATERTSRQSSTDGVEAQSLKPGVPPERLATPKAAGAASASRHRSRSSSRRPSGAERSGRSTSRLVTVPKPFKMMLREEDKKRRNVKTRSEVELENELLRRELEDLRQCRRQFRATPAPPRTHLPFSDVVNGGCDQRDRGRMSRPASLDRTSNSSAGSSRRRHRSSSSGGRSRNTSPQPFSFIERERKKREQRLEDALRNGLSSREDRWVFKARPLPHMYRAATEEYQSYGAAEMHSRGECQQHHPQQPVSSELLKHAGRRLERERYSVEEDMKASKEWPQDRDARPVLDNGNWRLRRKLSLGGKWLLVQGDAAGLRRIRERDWSYIHPIQRTCIN